MSDRLPGPAGAAGLARERTRLAWRRTALGAAAGSLAAGRLLAPLLGPWSWALAGAGLAATVVVVARATRHHVGSGTAPGRLVTGVTAIVAALGTLALVVLWTGHARVV
ncbi:DUF202 domain-containing protein [Cellulomonas sp.]|uniref:DUF202 domain-containing protein n=1 Tax=Cellulomonas sp. TaxID=40001 RepID=UPI00258912CC|nr:DUF202 domain-containing protein [Cellulomonas sp.]MCR6688493.1 DUF202 domain-containing protein [Cellulomonas sp.]